MKRPHWIDDQLLEFLSATETVLPVTQALEEIGKEVHRKREERQGEGTEYPINIYIGMPSGRVYLHRDSMWGLWGRDRALMILCIPLFVARAKKAIWPHIDLIRLLGQYV